MRLISACLGLVLATATTAFAQEKFSRFDVPRLGDVKVDGRGEGWADKGLQVDGFAPGTGKVRPVAEFDARMRLGWNSQGLLILVKVHDPTPLVAEPNALLYQCDSVEMFVAAGWGSPERYQIVFSPEKAGTDPGYRFAVYDHRANENLSKVPVSFDARCVPIADGYSLEMLLPWKNLGIEPAVGQEVALQMVVNDAMAPGARVQNLWFPQDGAHASSKIMHRLRLSEQAGPAIVCNAAAAVERFRWIRVGVVADATEAGQTAEVREGDRVLGTAFLQADAHRSWANLSLPLPGRGKTMGTMDVQIKGRSIAKLSSLDVEQQREEAIQDAHVVFKPCVFSGEVFPDYDFEQPSLMEDLIGQYTLKATFYDAQYNPVRLAKDLGRYGAIVEVRSESGRVFKRYCTLYRAPGSVRMWDAKIPLSAELPAIWGISHEASKSNAMDLSYWLARSFVADMGQSDRPAIVLAGVRESAATTQPATGRCVAWDRNDDWWFGLRRKIGDRALLPYQIQTPPGYDQEPSRRWPLLIHLHGSGRRDADKQDMLPRAMMSRPEFPCIAVAPLCPENEWWSASAVKELMDELIAKYRVDVDRVYLVGVSMGGFATWDIAERYPDRFAAIVPICGGNFPESELVRHIKDVPAWVFHGDQDDVVSPIRSVQMVDALKKVGGRVRLTIFPGVKHDSWVKAYQTAELYPWLLQQRRGKPAEPATAP